MAQTSRPIPTLTFVSSPTLAVASIPRRSGARRAFTLIELLLVVAIIALLITILLPALSHARKASRTARCQSNLHQLGVAMHTYGNDFRDHLYSFSWSAGDAISADPSLNNASSDINAACNEMVDIVRRQGDRTAAETPPFPANSFFPFLRYSHLVLQDYLGQRLPDPIVACPEDADQARWGLDPRGYDAGRYTPNYGTVSGGDPQAWRWPYRSNYWITVSAFDKNKPPQRAYPATYNSLYISLSPTVRYGNRKLYEVAFPANKVFMYEQYARHSTGKFDWHSFFAVDVSRPCIEMFDNSVSIRKSSDANKGGNPNNPMATGIYTMPYDATGANPDPAAPNGLINVPVKFQYTASGLRGIDYAGTDIRSSAY